MPENRFTGRSAERYDAGSASMFAPEVLGPTVDFLADLVGTGSVLELGVGTGRVALPLSERGAHVHGIDISSDMIEQLRNKPGADAVGLTVGDFATTRLGRTFDAAYLVFNTITNLTTQDEQVDCFRTVADHLEPGGAFVIEVFVPILQKLPPGEVYRTFLRTEDRHSFDEYDVVTQVLHSHHYLYGDDGTYEQSSAPYRYVWPSELDLMARLAGMRLRERWADWRRNPFTATSEGHVSVWEKV